MRIHEYLEIMKKNGKQVIRCIKCGHEFCGAEENYKKHSLLRERELCDVLSPVYCLSKEKPFVHYQEFICPGCGTLLQVDIVCPELEEDPVLWDIQIKV